MLNNNLITFYDAYELSKPYLFETKGKDHPRDKLKIDSDLRITKTNSLSKHQQYNGKNSKDKILRLEHQKKKKLKQNKTKQTNKQKKKKKKKKPSKTKIETSQLKQSSTTISTTTRITNNKNKTKKYR